MKIRRAGFPVRKTFEEFLERFFFAFLMHFFKLRQLRGTFD